jgi:hypothetical protein
MKRRNSLFSVCLLVGLIPMSVPAQGIDSFFDVFWLELGGDAQNWNQVTSGGGSGFDNGFWFPYPADPSPGAVEQVDPWGNVNPVPGWRNQWFYDGRYRPERYKVVDLSFTYALADPTQRGGTDIVINWSTPEWSIVGSANSPPTSNQYIGRATISRETWLEANDTRILPFNGRYDLRDLGVPFNPEWVSIDVVGYNVRLSSPSLPGSINHYCIPEPSSMLLLVGLAALAFYGRK